MRQRFRLEAQAIARLRHTNIVQIYDVGEHNDCPFLSLELVEGGNLAEWMGGKPKPANDAARAISTLAKAVEYAHHQGVVHRDLKPGNVLLSVLSDRPGKRELKITDFGIAKVLPLGGIAEARVTQTGEILGTPAYMAPEQARGNASEISPATDVYSLGAILYELLTGRPPFQGATPLDTLMLAARQDPVSIYLLVPSIPRDLNTICLKCLEKDPAKRYPSAAELAADLGRFLRKEPIHAKPLSFSGHAIRWMRRHQALAASLAAVVVLTVLLTASLTIATAHFRFLEQQQRALAHEKGELADEKETQRIRAVTAEQHETQLREQAQREGAELRQNLYFDQMNLASQAALSPSGIGRVHEWLSAWEEGQPDLRNWEWYFLNGLCHRDLLTLTGHLNGVLSVAWSPDGGRLASGGREGRVRIWDSSSGREITSFSRFDSDVTTVAWNPQGNRVAAAELNGVVKIWDVATGSEVLVFRGHKGAVFGVAWSPDGKSLASGGDDQAVRIWDAATGKVQDILTGNKQSVRDVQWSPDGKRVASAGEDWDIRIWNVADGSISHVLHGHINMVNRIAWSPDGNWLVSASNDQTIKLWCTNSGSEIKTMAGHTLEVQAVAWSPDGQRLASGAYDQTVKIWDPVRGIAIATFRGHTQGVTSVNWAPDSRRLASGSTDQTVKIWDIASPAEVPSLVGHTSNIWTVAWSADGRHLASGSEDQTVRIWDSATDTEQFQLRGHTNQIRAVAFKPDGSRLASAGLDQTIRIWDTTNGKQLAVLPGPLAVRALAWSPDGHRLASGGVDHLIHLWDPTTEKEVLTCKGHEGDINGLAFSPDGLRIASASGDQSVKIWDPASGRSMLTLYGSGGGFFSVAWSPDGGQLAAACNDQTIRIWNSTSGQLIRVLRGHSSSVMEVSWSPDGTRLGSCSDDQTVKLWDAQTGEEAISLNGAGSRVRSVAWSPDGCVLAAGGDEDRVLLFDATPGYIFSKSIRYLPILERRLAGEPRDRPARWIKAEIEARQGDWGKAADDLNQCFGPDQPQHWLSIGYWVSGPYPDDLGAGYAPETGPLPVPAKSEERAGAASTSSNWQWLARNPAGFVDFGSLFDHADHISAYALMRVFSPRDQNLAILLGSDDQIRLWLNGKVIHESLVQRGAVIDEDAVSAHLSAGWNTLLARVVNVTGPHELYLRLSDSPADLTRGAAAQEK